LIRTAETRWPGADDFSFAEFLSTLRHQIAAFTDRITAISAAITRAINNKHAKMPQLRLRRGFGGLYPNQRAQKPSLPVS